MAYRVPRRFILPPDDPPPYGFVALSLVGHGIFLLAAMILSVYVSTQIDRSNVYIVNLVPSPPSLGTAAPQAAPRPSVERPVKPPEPAPKPPKVEEREPPKPQKAETPPRDTPPPKPERVPEPPPSSRPSRAAEVARAVPPRPDELALPRRAEKEAPVLETSAARERLLGRTPLPPRPPAPGVAPSPTPPPPARPLEPPARVAPPPTPIASPQTATVAPRPVEPVRLGRPDAATTATGSISLDVSDFPFTYYLRQVQAKISERWSPPRAAAGGGERVVVMFEIGRDGQIKEPKLERESGNPLYDQSALRAVVDASPFPPLPAEFKASSLRVHFGFEFRPDQG